jgi:hypothetical protein
MVLTVESFYVRDVEKIDKGITNIALVLKVNAIRYNEVNRKIKEIVFISMRLIEVL